MKLIRLFLVVSIMLPGVTSMLPAQEYTIDFESNGKQIAVIALSIDGDEAITKGDGVTERFDLKNQCWQHTESKQWITLSQCETWAKQSREKSSNNKASIPEKTRMFVDWSLNPTFKVDAKEKTLTLTSGQVDYKIVGKKTDKNMTNFFRYTRLNAYKKAMTERKLPPYAELKVLDELERRKMLPESIEVWIPGVVESPTIKVIYHLKDK